MCCAACCWSRWASSWRRASASCSAWRWGPAARVEAFVNPIFLLLRPIPPLAWIPLAIVWLGLGDAAKMMVIFFAAFVPSVINSYTGVRQIDKPIFEAAAMLDVRGWRYWREVLIPGALPSIFTGLRLSLQASWTTLVAAELVGAVAGLGTILNQAAQDIYPAMILVGMISVALCGWLMTLGLGWIEQRVMPWKARLMLQPPLAPARVWPAVGLRRRGRLPRAVDAWRRCRASRRATSCPRRGTWSSASRNWWPSRSPAIRCTSTCCRACSALPWASCWRSWSAFRSAC